MLKRLAIGLVALSGLTLVTAPAIRDHYAPAHAATSFVLEPNLDRSGNDMARRVLPKGADVFACQALCAGAQGCRAFTYVKESITVPEPICWLKDGVPAGYPSSCCTSGVLQP